MRIGLLTTTEPWQKQLDGVSTVVRDLAGGLGNRGHDVSVFHIQGPGGGVPEAPYRRKMRGWGEYRAVHFPNPALRRSLAAWIRRERPEVLHGHWSFAECLGLLRDLPAAAPPLLLSLHTFEAVCPRKTHVTVAGEPCERLPGWGCMRTGCRSLRKRVMHDLPVEALRSRVAGRCRGWIVHNRELGRYAAQLGLDPVHVVPLGVGLPELQRPAVNDPVVLFAGRLRPDKGAVWFAAQVPDILGQVSAARVRIAGAGPSEEAMRREIPAELWDRVQFLGALDAEALSGEYSRARVTGVPSLWKENFGMVGLEALAHACPVVGSDVAGVREWLEHDVGGLKVERADAVAFTRAVTRLLTDASLATRLGQGARETAERLSLDAHLKAMEAIYAGACRA